MCHGETGLNFESLLKSHRGPVGIGFNTDPAFLIPSPKIFGIGLNSLFNPLKRLFALALLVKRSCECRHGLIEVGVELEAALQSLLRGFPIGSLQLCLA